MRAESSERHLWSQTGLGGKSAWPVSLRCREAACTQLMKTPSIFHASVQDLDAKFGCEIRAKFESNKQPKYNTFQ